MGHGGFLDAVRDLMQGENRALTQLVIANFVETVAALLQSA